MPIFETLNIPVIKFQYKVNIILENAAYHYLIDPNHAVVCDGLLLRLIYVNGIMIYIFILIINLN